MMSRNTKTRPLKRRIGVCRQPLELFHPFAYVDANYCPHAIVRTSCGHPRDMQVFLSDGKAFAGFDAGTPSPLLTRT